MLRDHRPSPWNWATGTTPCSAEGYARLRASGGSGNDNLEASFYHERVTFQGNEGNDVLIGGDRNDRLEAGSGRNQRTEGNNGRDICSGSDVDKVSCEA